MQNVTISILSTIALWIMGFSQFMGTGGLLLGIPLVIFILDILEVKLSDDSIKLKS